MANVPAKRIKVTGTFGSYGEDGATFTPEVSSDGTLSWVNNKGLDNPAPINVRGPKGDPGDSRLPEATEADEGKVVQIVDGNYVLTDPPETESDEPTYVTILEESEHTGFEDVSEEFGFPAEILTATFQTTTNPFTAGDVYIVSWDDSEYRVTAYEVGNTIALGNEGIEDPSQAVDPFLIQIETGDGDLLVAIIALNSSLESHRIGIVQEIAKPILPAVTNSDNGKFLKVVDGAWAAVLMESAEEASF